MLEEIYVLIHRIFSKPGQKEEYSGGYWQEKVRKIALELCKDVRGRLLEVGCGEGLFLSGLSGARPDLALWGVDNNESRLSSAGERCKKQGVKNVNFLLQDARSLDFQDGFFDAVVCVNVFFNMDSLGAVKEALSGIKRICKKEGLIIFDFRNSLNPLLKIKYGLAKYYDKTVKNLPLNTYSQGQISSMLDSLGLVIVKRAFVGPGMLAPIIIIEARKT